MMESVEIPEGFIDYAWLFHQDIDKEYGTDDPMAAAMPHIIKGIGEKSRKELKDFLELLLKRNCSDETLEEAWNAPGPCWKIARGGHRSFFKKTLEIIAEKYPDMP